MAKFRRRPGAIIEAEQFTDTNRSPKGLCGDADCEQTNQPHVHTTHEHQVVFIGLGDWIIPEPDGNGFYPCKPDIFAATYEDASEEAVKVPTLSKCLGCGEEHLNYIPHRCGVCPGPCNLCEGSSHHWMEFQDETDPEKFYWHCKHCPVRVPYGEPESHPEGCDCPDHSDEEAAGTVV